MIRTQSACPYGLIFSEFYFITFNSRKFSLRSWMGSPPSFPSNKIFQLLFLFQADPQWWAEWGVVWWGEDHHQSWEVSSLCLYVRVLKCFESDLFIFFSVVLFLKFFFLNSQLKNIFPIITDQKLNLYIQWQTWGNP